MILSIDNAGEPDGGTGGVVCRYIYWCGHECQQQVASDKDNSGSISEDWSNHIADFINAVNSGDDDVKFYEE